MTTVCPECGRPVAVPGLYLAQPAPDALCLDYCSPACGAKADARTQLVSVAPTVRTP